MRQQTIPKDNLHINRTLHRTWQCKSYSGEWSISERTAGGSGDNYYRNPRFMFDINESINLQCTVYSKIIPFKVVMYYLDNDDIPLYLDELKVVSSKNDDFKSMNNTQSIPSQNLENGRYFIVAATKESVDGQFFLDISSSEIIDVQCVTLEADMY